MDYKQKAEKISTLLNVVTKKMRAEVNRHIESFGLTVPQLFLLRVLFRSGGSLSISEISRQMGLSNSTVSGIVDRLEKEGYTERQRDAKDRRVVYVKLTDKTHELKKQIPDLRSDYFAGWLKDIDPDKIERIEESLTILVGILDARAED
ncbi:MAG TPA: MarR family transcriptional regulator [Verrucomicrobiae bacterium]|nr:MarR family transcriptional regulator [Verrucomicrobiae bacterium]